MDLGNASHRDEVPFSVCPIMRHRTVITFISGDGDLNQDGVCKSVTSNLFHFYEED